MKDSIRTVLPVSIRKKICLSLNRSGWFDEERRHWWTLELLRDYAEREPNEFHRFLWTHHLAYASSYTVTDRFGKDALDGSRRLFFRDLETHLAAIGVDPAKDIGTIFEVGCSLGYQLRFLETTLFPAAKELRGIDIDRYAIREGVDYLRRIGSKVILSCEDMGNIDQLLKTATFDVLIATGVLMYLEEREASRAIRSILRCCGKMVALAGLAHPEKDNLLMDRSEIRTSDGSFVHNFDAMVIQAGGKVLARRWEGAKLIDGRSIYFVFAVPGRPGQGSIGATSP